MQIMAKLYLVDNNGTKFMGIGVLWLLQEIVKTNSLRAAAANLNLSYSKAYKMVKSLEKHIGQKVLERQRGGSEHRGATVNEFGHQFIALYDKFQNGAKELLNGPFEIFIKDFEILRKQYGKEKQQ